MPELSEPYMLSTTGSTRATAYKMTNKAVRIGDLTHVTWLDAVARVMAATYDHASGAWSPPVFIGEGIDNHTNPALSAAPDGQLRLAYGPHGFWEKAAYNQGRFRLCVSARPNDSSAWQHVNNIGYGATYACLQTDSRGRDHLVYRGGAGPPGARYERRQPHNTVDRGTLLAIENVEPAYTFVGATLTIGPGDVLYAAFMYYYGPRETSRGVCAIKSPDGGTTWTGMDDRPIALPLDYDPAHAPPHGSEKPYTGSMAVDLEGDPWIITNDLGPTGGGHFLSVHRDGRWRPTRLEPFLPDGLVMQQATMTIDAKGRILIAADVNDAAAAANGRWGHPSRECLLLCSADEGRTFSSTPISRPDPEVPNWLANISRTGPNHDLRDPLIIYTHGFKGEGCAPPDTTEVHAVWVGN